MTILLRIYLSNGSFDDGNQRGGWQHVDVGRILEDLRRERDELEDAIASLERLGLRSGRRRGRSPAWLSKIRADRREQALDAAVEGISTTDDDRRQTSMDPGVDATLPTGQNVKRIWGRRTIN